MKGMEEVFSCLQSVGDEEGSCTGRVLKIAGQLCIGRIVSIGCDIYYHNFVVVE
jgi:hypothetical protein